VLSHYDASLDRLKQFVLSIMRKKVGKPPRQYLRDFRVSRVIGFEITRGETGDIVGPIGRHGSAKLTLLPLVRML
jgi:ABC-type polysaccharide/polyol phosphate transport system ATPase subunit